MKDAASSQMKYILEGDPSQYAEEWDIIGHITADFPPAFVMSATGDMCLPYAEPMYNLLTEKGIEAELHIYGDDQASSCVPHQYSKFVCRAV